MPDIAYINKPGQISLTGNPVIFKIAGKNAFSASDIKNQLTLNKSGAFSEGQTMVLSWNSKSCTVTSKAVTVTDLDVNLTAENEDIFNALLASADLVEDYIISLNNDGDVNIIARNAGSAYIITKTGTLPVTATQTAGDDAESPNLYKLITKVEVDNEFITEHALPVSPDASEENYPPLWIKNNIGYADINLNDILLTELRGHFSLNLDSQTKHVLHNILKMFRLYSFEQSGIPPTKSSGLFSDYYYALQGKLEDFRQGELNYFEKNFAELLSESQMFLSFAPLVKLTDIYAPERFYFLFRASGTYRLWCTETYTDGSTYTAQRDQLIASGISLYEFDCSYKGIRTNQDKTLKEYKIWLTNASDERISEERTFIIDYTFYNNARYFYFKNSLGVYECIRFTAAAIKNLSISKEFINIPYDKRFSNLDRQEKQLISADEISYEINTGYFYDKYWADYFQQFLKSDDVYWLKKGAAYPVSIRDSKNEVSKDGEYNQFAVFTLIHSIHDDFTEEFITTQPISIGDYSFDFNTDYFVGSGILFYNVEKYQDFVRNNCGSGYAGTTARYTVAANTYTSIISQADADQKAMDDIAANGQTYANLYGYCVLDSGINPLTASIATYTNPTVHDASDGIITLNVSGGLAPYTYLWNDGITTKDRTGLPAGNYSCIITDSIGNTANVSQVLTNPAEVFYNPQVSGTFRKNNCGSGYTGSLVEYIVAANTYSSLISVADAINQAEADIAANGQAYANANGTCTLINNGSLSISKDNEVTAYEVNIHYLDGTSDRLTQTSSYPATVKQMQAMIILLGTTTGAYINGDTYNRIEYGTPTMVTFDDSTTFHIEN